MDGSVAKGATRSHERPVIAAKPSVEKMQEVKRSVTATTAETSEPVKTDAVRKRPLSSDGSDGRTPQINHKNVEKTVSQETCQNHTKDRRTKVQQTQTMKQSEVNTRKNRKIVLQKGRKKK